MSWALASVAPWAMTRSASSSVRGFGVASSIARRSASLKDCRGTSPAGTASMASTVRSADERCCSTAGCRAAALALATGASAGGWARCWRARRATACTAGATASSADGAAKASDRFRTGPCGARRGDRARRGLRLTGRGPGRAGAAAAASGAGAAGASDAGAVGASDAEPSGSAASDVRPHRHREAEPRRRRAPPHHQASPPRSLPAAWAQRRSVPPMRRPPSPSLVARPRRCREGRRQPTPALDRLRARGTESPQAGCGVVRTGVTGAPISPAARANSRVVPRLPSRRCRSAGAGTGGRRPADATRSATGGRGRVTGRWTRWRVTATDVRRRARPASSVTERTSCGPWVTERVLLLCVSFARSRCVTRPAALDRLHVLATGGVDLAERVPGRASLVVRRADGDAPSSTQLRSAQQRSAHAMRHSAVRMLLLAPGRVSALAPTGARRLGLAGLPAVVVAHRRSSESFEHT